MHVTYSSNFVSKARFIAIFNVFLHILGYFSYLIGYISI